jgi:type VI secretion system protein ImpL
MVAFRTAKLMRLILALALLVLCALLAWAFVLFVLGLDIQWWARAMILTCLAATVIIIFLMRKLWLKRKEMKFVDGIIGSDMPGNISALDEASRELRKRFKEAVTTLKKSHLKGRGNPLYVLPWYLIIGKSGSGKSTAIKSARLPSPFGDVNRISGIEGTRNCDWWFFDDSVVIDIAGRYSLHRNEDLDRNEWLSFLSHLAKYRKREPINGIIVTVEADQLIEGDLEKIEEEGRTIRRRIDEVIQGMGAKFPIYLLITKCDLIFGVESLGRLLPEATLEQAMGMMNHEGETDIAVIVNKTVDVLVDKLKDIRLILSNKDEVRDRHYVDPEVLLFPDELARVRKGLMVFCKGAFKDNPFQELPPVRGIYFCSGQQSGRPVLSQANAVSKLASKELPGTGHGFFLHDFFAWILPADRRLYAPTRRAKEWHRLTSNLWLTGFITIVLLLCILLTHSWNENKAAINAVSPQYKKNILFKNDPVSDTAIMAELERQIKKIAQINADWETPRMGLDASIRLEKELKQRYCQRFYEHFDAEINTKIEAQIADGGWSKDNFEPAVRFIPFLTRRINLIKARFAGAGFKQLAELPDPDYALMMFGEDRKPAADEILSRYKNVYIDYLIWQTDIEQLNKSLAGMQRLLGNYFSESQGDMRWLVTWADRHLRGKAITMNVFWHGNNPDGQMAVVGPAYTREGRKLIGHFVTNELESAVDRSVYIEQPKARFAAWYEDAYYGAWLDLCTHFGQGRALFTTDDDWQIALERLAGDDTPYMKLFDVMENELFSMADQHRQQWPSLKLQGEAEEKYGLWLGQIRNFLIVRHAATGDTAAENQAVKIVGNKVSGKVASAARIALGTMEHSRLAKAKEAYRQYQSAMAAFAGVTSDSKYAYQVARAGFEDNPAEAKSNLQAADKAIASLKTALTPDNDTSTADSKDPFWSLLTDPLDLLWRFSVAQAGCHLQNLWDQDVIVKVQGVRDPGQLSVMLFGDRGIAQKYVQTYARPFLQLSSSRGYSAAELQGAHIPFYRRFLYFLRKGEHWQAVSGGRVRESYNVTVAAYPTDVNSDARLRPYMTRLILEDTEGPAILENKQFPVEKQFTWRPASDGKVTLQILFENVTLNIEYSGYCAFGKFLRDFSSGYSIFKAYQFPEQLTELNRIGVKKIDVTYKMQRNQIRPILRLMRAKPGRPPAKIINCEASTN